MATFIVRGELDGIEVEISWSDELEERFGGDSTAIARVDEIIASGDWVDLTPTGPGYTAGRDPAVVAFTTIIAALDDVSDVAGDVPEIPIDVPAGAKA